MNYLDALCTTYDRYSDRAGEEEIKAIKDREISYMLLPISHTTQTAHIEVLVTENGEFYDAEVIPKVNTVLPFTESSGSRTAALSPHVLHDKLVYVAGDYVAYTGETKKDKGFSMYIEQLGKWCDSEFSHPHVEAVYKYLKKAHLIEDLIKQDVLYADANQKLLKKWPSKDGVPDIFKTVTGGQEAAFVRFSVHVPGKVTTPIWKDKEVFNAYQNYYATLLKENALCYVSGKELPLTSQHPNKIRNSGDKTKLISSNDNSGFTFRGRFTEANQVASISYEASQKAHNALKWLIERQGRTIDGRVFLTWGLDELEVDSPVETPIQTKPFEEPQEEVQTMHSLAKAYGKLLAGYKASTEVRNGKKIYIMTLDAATPGRLSVLYYRCFDVEEYFGKLQKWHEDAEWYQSYYNSKEKKWESFIGAPSLERIAKFVYGSKASEALVKGTIERLLPSILDQRVVPADIVRSAVQQASNPVAFETFEWEQVLQVACSLVKKQNVEKGIYHTMTLNRQNTNRHYLYGRLLAVADVFERNAIKATEKTTESEKSKEKLRATNAIRYMNAFAGQPHRTWKTIHESLQPYLVREGSKAVYAQREIQEIMGLFEEGEYNNQPLNGDYLLGYYNQCQALYTKKEEAGEQ
ncbi:type I-C CRISPR-associated protein Cas8c/Csd1 [Kurthia populi]|uniref:Type I-C CRISPR-associated protein Cas8c/Csd1 n=1 Tax=Kurthia populi TaxID=1562132 RepID=A0ABW5XZG7_9BACL